MDLRFTPRFIDDMTNNVRDLIEMIRGTERDIMKICVKEGKMPRKDFIALFPGNETNLNWSRSIARSRDPGLHGRKPVFTTPRALALSYVEGYVDFTGAIKAYGVVDLRDLGAYDWRLSDRNVWKVEQYLLDWPHRPIRSSPRRIDALRARYRRFREAHGHKPWKYYSGREQWTTLPAEFSAAAGHQLLSTLGIRLTSFPVGDYRLEIKVTDRPTGRELTQSVNFTVVA